MQQPEPTPSPTAASKGAQTLLTDPERAADHAFTVGSVCWSVWCSSVGKGLVRAVSGPGSVVEYDMGESGPSSLTASHAVTDDGAVWIALNYVVARILDGKISAWPLPESVEGQLPGATDRSAPLAGTWATALAPDGADSVYLARLNVPYLVRVSASGAMTQGPDLPAGYEGAQSLDRQGEDLYLAPGWLAPYGHGVGVLRTSGTFEEVPIPGVLAFDNGLAITGSEAFDVETGKQAELPAVNPVTAFLRTDGRGEQVWWDQAGNTITHTALGQLSLETDAGASASPGVAPDDGGGGLIGGPAPFDGSDVDLDVPAGGELVTGLAVDSLDRVWILRDGGHRLDVWS